MKHVSKTILVAAMVCICSLATGCGDSNTAGTGSTPSGDINSQLPVHKLPDPPAVVEATGGSNKVTLTWNGVSGADSYNIYWSSAPGVTPATGTKISGVTSPYQHDGLFVSQTYFYVVTAVNSNGESIASHQVATVSANNGADLYDIFCTGCHGPLASTTIMGGTPEKVTAAIANNTGGMGGLSTLTSDQINNISLKLPCH